MVEAKFRPRSLTLESMRLLPLCCVSRDPEPGSAGRALDAGGTSLPRCQAAGLPFGIDGGPGSGSHPTEAAAYLFHVVPVGDGCPRDGIFQVEFPSIFLNFISDEPVFFFHSHQQLLKDIGQARSALRSNSPHWALACQCTVNGGEHRRATGDGSGSQHHHRWPSQTHALCQNATKGFQQMTCREEAHPRNPCWDTLLPTL